MTRMGITDVAVIAADKFLRRSNYFDFCSLFLDRGQTPIFEYTAPDNRIVLNYPTPELTLLQGRVGIGRGRVAQHGHKLVKQVGAPRL